MRITGEEKAALVKHGHRKSGSARELLAGEVAGKRPRGAAAAIRAVGSWRQQAHDTHERPEWHFDAGLEQPHVAFEVEHRHFVWGFFGVELAQTAARTTARR